MKIKKQKILGGNNRFLIGLVLALSFTLVAFEWTSIEEHDNDIYNSSPIHEDNPELLTPITARQEYEQPKPKTSGADFDIVKEILEKNPVERPEDKPKPLDLTIDPSLYGNNSEELPEENHPKIEFKKIELYPHTNACIGLDGSDMLNCSQEEIIRLIKSRISIPQALFELRGRHGVQMEFTVNKEGLIEDVKVLQQTNNTLAVEAKKTLLALPKLNPAIQNGMPVSMRMKIPIVIDIRE